MSWPHADQHRRSHGCSTRALVQFGLTTALLLHPTFRASADEWNPSTVTGTEPEDPTGSVGAASPSAPPVTDPEAPPEDEVIPPQSHLLSANPDAPGVSFVWRGQLRGTLSVPIPLTGRPQRPGLSVSILTLIELYNSAGSGQLLPNEGWRGLLGAQAGWMWGERATERRFYLGGAVVHESDHATARADAPLAALALNEITAIAAFQLPQPKLMVRVELQTRALIVTCTSLETDCSTFQGSTSFGAEGDLVLDTGGAEPLLKHWYFFASLHGGAVVPNREVIRELRAVIHVGVFVRVRLGVWQLFALGFFGNDIGIDRGETVYQGGAGVRWMY